MGRGNHDLDHVGRDSPSTLGPSAVTSETMVPRPRLSLPGARGHGGAEAVAAAPGMLDVGPLWLPAGRKQRLGPPRVSRVPASPRAAVGLGWKVRVGPSSPQAAWGSLGHRPPRCSADWCPALRCPNHV